MTSTESVLAEVNMQTGKRWRLVRAYAGGHQSGATEIHDGPQRAVLKWWDRPAWASRVLGAATLVEQARARGYPTPAWLAVGTTAAGFPYEVQEFVDGAPIGRLGVVEAGLLIELVRLQGSITLDTDVDWAVHIHDLVFDAFDERVAEARAFDRDAAAAVDAALALAAPFRDEPIADRQMVHGDLSLRNVLVRDGRVTGAVDIEAIGRGPAVFDLLTPIRQGYIWGGDEDAIALFMRGAFAMAPPGTVAVAAAAHVVNILAFGRDHWPEKVPAAASQCRRWIADVRWQLSP